MTSELEDKFQKMVNELQENKPKERKKKKKEEDDEHGAFIELKNLDSHSGRKQVLKDIIAKHREGKATPADAIRCVTILEEFDKSTESAKKIDPYSVMKVFLRAEGLTNAENLKNTLGAEDIAKGLCKIFEAYSVSIKWKDGAYGHYAVQKNEERSEVKTERVAECVEEKVK